jgi:hypothetical protein
MKSQNKTIGLSQFVPMSVLGLALGLTPAVSKADFIDLFHGATVDPAWQQDRFEPSTVAIVPNPAPDAVNLSNTVLDLGVSAADFQGQGSFYDYQGITRQNLNVTGDWTVNADLYVSPDLASTTGTLEATTLWTRNSDPVEANAFYPIIGISNASPTDPYNPAAIDRVSRWRVFNSTLGSYVDLPLLGTPTVGWHDLTIQYTGSDYLYSIDGSQVYDETPASDPSVGNLQGVYLEDYNFGQSYDAYWDIVSATSSVPEPASAGLLMVGGAAVLMRRRKRLA